MKTFRTIAFIVLCIGLLFGATSCVVLVKEDNGKHKGWFKNSNNPHHPDNTNPGKSKGNPRK
jgi:hypothetical protein